MEESSKRPADRSSIFVGLPLLWVFSALVLAALLEGCAGSIDPTQFGSGGSSGTATGGTTGSGGSSGGSGGSATGGTTGSGGSNGGCTGSLAGVAIIGAQCATAVCHSATSAATSAAGLDLTTNSTIGSRLVGVVSPGDVAAASQCGGNPTPYLNAGSNPATGLLIEKIQQAHPPCGFQMPFGQPPLSAMQQTCLVEWATTLTTASQ